MKTPRAEFFFKSRVSLSSFTILEHKDCFNRRGNDLVLSCRHYDSRWLLFYELCCPYKLVDSCSVLDVMLVAGVLYWLISGLGELVSFCYE